MGLFGFGKDDAKDAKDQVAQTKSALEQAQEAPKDQGFVGNHAAKLVENLLDSGIDGKGPFDSAAKVAASALKKSNGDVDKAVDSVINGHLKLAAGSGFVTGLGGFITLPISLPANVLGFYLLATRMTGAIASLRGHDITQQQIRTAVLLTLVGADADDLLAKAGMVAPSGRITNLAAQRLPGPALMVVNKAVGFRLLSTAGKKTFSRFGRNVPLIGGVVGAGLDGWLLKRISENARREFASAPSAPSQISEA